MPFHDARQVRHDDRIDADVCIVGAGAAGIALAREFAHGPFKVVVLESGGFRFDRRTQALYAGEIVALDNHSPTFSRFRQFGGSTTRWAGKCRPLNPLDFEPRDGIRYSGWPFDYRHLEPWYRRAQNVCNLDQDDAVEPIRWQAGSAAGSPVAGSRLETPVFRFGDPKDFGQAYRAQLEQADNVAVYLHANVMEITACADLRRITSVAVKTFAGQRFEVRSRAFVLACGGLENPRLLLASNRQAATGLGNDHDLVGRFFMDHPYLLLGQFLPDDPRYAEGPHIVYELDPDAGRQRMHLGFALSEQALRADRLNSCVAYFIRVPPYKFLPETFSTGSRSMLHVARVLLRRDHPGHDFRRHLVNIARGHREVAVTARAAARDLLTRSRRQLALRAVVEATPCPDSRVTLAGGRDRLGSPGIRVAWRINTNDRRGIDQLHQALREIFQQRGVGRLVENGAADANGLPAAFEAGKHHMGTTRMHTDPRQGVVDSDGRIHSLANLYVTGGSVFPTCGYANPTFTVVALALRLADHLKKRLQTAPLG